MKFHQELHMDHLCNINNDIVLLCMKEDINVLFTEYLENQWSMKINRESTVHGNGRNKLRTYLKQLNKFLNEITQFSTALPTDILSPLSL